jgi:hypothetical protein
MPPSWTEAYLERKRQRLVCKTWLKRLRIRIEANNTSDEDLKATGLEVEFSSAVALAAIEYPFEYAGGIVLKGYSTILVATDVVGTEANIGIQWHFQSSHNHVQLSEFTDTYQPWRVGSEKTLEEVASLRRHFIGWCGNAEVTLGTDSLPHARLRTSAMPSGERTWNFKEIIFGGGLASPFSLNVQVVMARRDEQKRHEPLTYFPKLIEDSQKESVLVYSVNEDRGWLVPRLSALHFMVFLHAKDSRLEPEPPRATPNSEDTRRVLLENSELQLSPEGISAMAKAELSQRLKHIFMAKHNRLEWAEEHCRQHRARNHMFYRNNIYGVELYDIAIDRNDSTVKKTRLRETHGGWIKLVDLPQTGFKGVLFCDGLGDVIKCSTSARPGRLCDQYLNIPKEKSYLCATIPCLRNLELGNAGRHRQALSSETSCTPSCSSKGHQFHRFVAKTAASVVPDGLPQSGCMVFGKPPQPVDQNTLQNAPPTLSTDSLSSTSSIP